MKQIITNKLSSNKYLLHKCKLIYEKSKLMGVAFLKPNNMWSWKLTTQSLPLMYDGWMMIVKREFSDLKALALRRFSATPPSFLGHWSCGKDTLSTLQSNSGLTNGLLVHPTQFPPTPWVDPEITWKYEVMHMKLIVNRLTEWTSSLQKCKIQTWTLSPSKAIHDFKRVIITLIVFHPTTLELVI